MLEKQVFDKIVNSKNMDKTQTPGGRYEAPCTRYYFDGFSVEQCHNGCETVRVIANGSTIGRVSRETLWDALKEREAKAAAAFLAS